MTIEKKYTILLSAEQCAESEGFDWIREATNEEIADAEEESPGVVFSNLTIDSVGRPYFWVTICGESAPENVVAKVSRNLRVMRW